MKYSRGLLALFSVLAFADFARSQCAPHPGMTTAAAENCIKQMSDSLPIGLRVDFATLYAANIPVSNAQVFKLLGFAPSNASNQIDALERQLLLERMSSVDLHTVFGERLPVYNAPDPLADLKKQLPDIVARLSTVETMSSKSFRQGALEFIKSDVGRNQSLQRRFAQLDSSLPTADFLAKARVFVSDTFLKAVADRSIDSQVQMIQNLRAQFLSMPADQKTLVGIISPSTNDIRQTAGDVFGVTTVLQEQKAHLQDIASKELALREQMEGLQNTIASNSRTLKTTIAQVVGGQLAPIQLEQALKQAGALDDQNRYLVSFVTSTLRNGADLNVNAESVAKQILPMINVDPQVQSTIQKVLQTRFDLSKGVDSFVNSANLSSKDVLGTLKQLGVRQDVIDVGTKAFSSVDGVKSVVSAVASGNYLQIATSIASVIGLNGIPGIGGLFSGGGLFGGGGGSDDSAQLAAISQQLSQISAQLREVDNRIIDLTNMVAKDHAETMYMLDRINNNVLYATHQLAGLLSVEFKACYELQDIQGYATPELQAQWFQMNGKDFSECSRDIDTIAIHDGNINPHFEMSSYDDGDYKYKEVYKAEVVAPLLDYFDILYGTSAERSVAISALVYPSLDGWSLRRKSLILDSLPDPDDVVVKNLREFLSPEATMEFAEYVLLVDDYRHRINYTSSPQSLSSISNIDPTAMSTSRIQVDQRTATMQLQKALELVNLAIAQQSMLSGDILLYRIKDELKLSDVGTALPAIAALMKNDPIFAENIVFHSLEVAFGDDSLSYGVAANSTDTEYLQSLLDRKGSPLASVPLTHNDDQGRWYAVIHLPTSQPKAGVNPEFEDVKVPLPTVKEFVARQLRTTAYLLDLLRTRERIVERKSGYGVDGKQATQLAFLSLLKAPPKPSKTPSPKSKAGEQQ